MKDSISERASRAKRYLWWQTKQLTGQAVREVLTDRFLINLDWQVTDIYLLIEDGAQHATSREQD
jgi:hypothetical protein